MQVTNIDDLPSNQTGIDGMRDKIIEHLTTRFQSYSDLADEVSDEMLLENLSVPKNKTLREHFWCVVGARESYTKAIEAGEWSGFNCSMQKVDKADVVEQLTASAEAFERVVANVHDWTEERDELLTSLLEHEVMHEGQMIRHVYGLERSLPPSWKWA